MVGRRIILVLAVWLGIGHALLDGLPPMSESNMTVVDGASGFFEPFGRADFDFEDSLDNPLDKRQGRCRPGTRPCGALCCPASAGICCGTFCCASSHPVCQPNRFCCPRRYEACGAINPTQCKLPGYNCCPPPQNFACPRSTTCCGDSCCLKGSKCFNNRVCCAADAVPCDGWCCAKGTKCSAQKGMCLEAGFTKTGSQPSKTNGDRPPKSTPTRTRTRTTSTRTRPTVSISTPDDDETTTKPGPTLTKPTDTDEPTPTETTPTKKPTDTDEPTPTDTTPTKKPTDTDEPTPTDTKKPTSTPDDEDPTSTRDDDETTTESEPTGTQSSSATGTSSEDETGSSTGTETTKTEDSSSTTASSTSTASAMPTIIFPYVPKLTDDLVKNMCLGLRSRLAPVNEEVLRYAGARSGLRDQTRCKNGDCCKGQTKGSGPNQGWPLSCDEYPFASALEGGANAHVGCITAFQNGAQGDYLKGFYRMFRMRKNQKFLMKITGIDCDEVKEDEIPGCTRFAKRDVMSESKGVFYPPDAGSDRGRLVIALGDVQPGPYNVMIRFPPNSDVTSVEVINNQGHTFAGTSTPSGPMYMLSFVFEQTTYGASIIAETKQSNLTAMEWDLEKGPAPNGTMTSSTPPVTTTETTVIDGTTITTTYCPESSTTTSSNAESETVITTIVEGTTIVTTICPESETTPTNSGIVPPPSPPPEVPTFTSSPEQSTPQVPPPGTEPESPPSESGPPAGGSQVPPPPPPPEPTTPPGDHPTVSGQPPIGGNTTAPIENPGNAGSALSASWALKSLLCVMVPVLFLA